MTWRDTFKKLLETLDAFTVEILKSSDILISPPLRQSRTWEMSTPLNTSQLKNSPALTGSGSMSTKQVRASKSIYTRMAERLLFLAVGLELPIG